MPVHSRPPTGKVPWPTLLLEGEEKAGKSYQLALLSASDKVGDSYWLDLAEGAADEYGALPGVRYQVLEHDGTFKSILEQIRAVHAEATRAAAAGEKPVVLGVDTMTHLWDGLKDGAAAQAKARHVKRKGGDPTKLLDDEVVITSDLWNVANARWRTVMTLLLTFPGIVVMIARGKETAVIGPNGQPVEGKKKWTVEGQKNLAFDATAVIRMLRDGALLVGARSIHCGVVPGVDKAKPMGADWEKRGLEWFIFDALQVDPANTHTRDLRGVDASEDEPEPTDPKTALAQARADAAIRFRDQAKEAWDNATALRAIYDDAKEKNLLREMVTAIENEAVVSLEQLIVTRGKNLTTPPADKPAETSAETPPAEQAS